VRFTLIEYAFLLLTPFALVLALAQHEARVGLLAPLLLLPWAVRLYLRVRRTPSGAWLNGALASTAKLGLVFAILLSVGSTA